MNKELTAEEYEQMIQALENGSFVPTANPKAPLPLYQPYNNWEDWLEDDALARDEVSFQYRSFITNP